MHACTHARVPDAEGCGSLASSMHTCRRTHRRCRTQTDNQGCCLVVTTGGTGPAPRDVTPEATEAVCSRMLPGYGEQMRSISLKYVPTAVLSRQTAGAPLAAGSSARGGSLLHLAQGACSTLHCASVHCTALRHLRALAQQ